MRYIKDNDNLTSEIEKDIQEAYELIADLDYIVAHLEKGYDNGRLDLDEMDNVNICMRKFNYKVSLLNGRIDKHTYKLFEERGF